MSAFADELERRGLLRDKAVMRLLRIDEDALRYLVGQRQLREVKFKWGGKDRVGYPKEQVEGAEAVYRNGLRLVRREQAAQESK